MQYLVVTFPDSRKVYSDDYEIGETNVVLRVEEGTHRLNLGEPKDYAPETREVEVRDTTPVKPMEVGFEKA